MLDKRLKLDHNLIYLPNHEIQCCGSKRPESVLPALQRATSQRNRISIKRNMFHCVLVCCADPASALWAFCFAWYDCTTYRSILKAFENHVVHFLSHVFVNLIFFPCPTAESPFALLHPSRNVPSAIPSTWQ